MLAPNTKLRAMVVPQEPEPAAQATPPAEREANFAHHRPARLSWARLLNAPPPRERADAEATRSLSSGL